MCSSDPASLVSPPPAYPVYPVSFQSIHPGLVKLIQFRGLTNFGSWEIDAVHLVVVRRRWFEKKLGRMGFKKPVSLPETKKIRRRWKDLKEIWGESGELGIGGIGLGILELQLRLTDPLAPRSCWGWKSWERERLLEEVQEGEHYCKKTKVVKNLKRSSKEWSSPSSEGSHGFLVRSSSYGYGIIILY